METDDPLGNNEPDEKTILQNESHEDLWEESLCMIHAASSPLEKLVAVIEMCRKIDVRELDVSSRKKLQDAISLECVKGILSNQYFSDSIIDIKFHNVIVCIISNYLMVCKDLNTLYEHLPYFTDLLYSDVAYEDIALINDCFYIVDIIISENEGKEYALKFGIASKLVQIYTNKKCKCYEALKILCKLCKSFGSILWLHDRASIHNLLISLTDLLPKVVGEEIYDICNYIGNILPSVPKDCFYEIYDKPWQSLHKGIYYAISPTNLANLTDTRRLRYLILANAVFKKLGTGWVISCGEDGSCTFVLKICVLACCHLEDILKDKSFHECISSSDVIILCCEIVVLAGEYFSTKSEGSYRVYGGELVLCIHDACIEIISFLNDAISNEFVKKDELCDYMKVKMVIIKVLGLWLVDGANTCRSDTQTILPWVVDIAANNFTNIMKLDWQEIRENEWPYAFEIILPAVHFMSYQDNHKIFLYNIFIEELLFEYIRTHWCLCAVEENVNNEISDKACINITIACKIIMNIIVREPDRIIVELSYSKLFKFLLSKTPEIPNSKKFLKLLSMFCTLGTTILKYYYPNFNRSETNFLRFIQCTVRFLWDAHNMEESADLCLTVSTAYKIQWDELLEPWCLTIKNLTHLIYNVQWLCEFLVDSEWPQSLIGLLHLIKDGGLEPYFKYAYEDFLCSVAYSSTSIKELFKLKSAQSVAIKHDMNLLLATVSS